MCPWQQCWAGRLPRAPAFKEDGPPGTDGALSVPARAPPARGPPADSATCRLLHGATCRLGPHPAQACPLPWATGTRLKDGFSPDGPPIAAPWGHGSTLDSGQPGPRGCCPGPLAQDSCHWAACEAPRGAGETLAEVSPPDLHTTGTVALIRQVWGLPPPGASASPSQARFLAGPGQRPLWSMGFGGGQSRAVPPCSKCPGPGELAHAGPGRARRIGSYPEWTPGQPPSLSPRNALGVAPSPSISLETRTLGRCGPRDRQPCPSPATPVAVTVGRDLGCCLVWPDTLGCCGLPSGATVAVGAPRG
ncbi:hypothetical protein J1605_022495 [Eschrichtius robustus]|uniref:Uncharacterized protein n=1 Tax=Eschrichtius robustus TaxID=9764 RepID=A0AB34HB63_ESCRO|nr:hypothetical protein J1605_022495 [Eschrichtius robustus]